MISGAVVGTGDAIGSSSIVGVEDGRLQELRNKMKASQINHNICCDDFFNNQPQAKWNIHNQGVCTTSATILVARLAVSREVD